MSSDEEDATTPQQGLRVRKKIVTREALSAAALRLTQGQREQPRQRERGQRTDPPW